MSSQHPYTVVYLVFERQKSFDVLNLLQGHKNKIVRVAEVIWKRSLATPK